MPNQSGTSQLELWSNPRESSTADDVQSALDLFSSLPSPGGQLDTSFAKKRPLKIMVADDNEINRKVIRVILEKLGYSCTETTTGLETLDRYKNDPRIDYIFMDVDMPEMNGLEASRAIRELEADSNDASRIPIEIIAVTANVSEDTRLACKRAGMNGYLEKPITSVIIKDQLLRSWTRIRSRRKRKQVEEKV